MEAHNAGCLGGRMISKSSLKDTTGIQLSRIRKELTGNGFKSRREEQILKTQELLHSVTENDVGNRMNL